MNARPRDARRLDVDAFARGALTLEGEWPLGELRRVMEACHPDAADAGAAKVRWQARGEARPSRSGTVEIWLHLEVDAPLELVCQRCLGPVRCALHVERSLRFVAGEDEAARLDAESDDDVLELTRHVDLQALIEDELLLELPLVPRHETCPPDAPARYEGEPDAPAADERPHPFAALAALRRDPPSSH